MSEEIWTTSEFVPVLALRNITLEQAQGFARDVEAWFRDNPPREEWTVEAGVKRTCNLVFDTGFPVEWGATVFDIIVKYIAVFDHAMYAACTRLGVVKKNQVDYPFAKNLDELSVALRRGKSKQIDARLHAILAQQFMKDDEDNVLWIMNQLRNRVMHRVVLTPTVSPNSIGVIASAERSEGMIYTILPLRLPDENGKILVMETSDLPFKDYLNYELQLLVEDDHGGMFPLIPLLKEAFPLQADRISGIIKKTLELCAIEVPDIAG